MKPVGLSLLIFLAVGAGGGSLVLLVYFLLVGPLLVVEIAHTHAARLGWDALLCLAFFFQHSGMIRRGAKERAARRIPAVFYPAVYSIASGAALFALILMWQPTGQFIYRLGGPAQWLPVGVSLLAVAGFAWGAQSLPAFDPFGTGTLKAGLGAASPPPSTLVVRGPYRYVRHPLYLFMLLLIWSAPRLSTDRLLFNLLWTAWIVVGTRLEERDLLADFGQTYRRYQLSVPMLIPFVRRRTHPDPAA